MPLYSFERLAAWQEARKLVAWVYKMTALFPSEEKYGLASQMKRASLSVVSNLAEGSARRTARDQAHFYQIAYGSLVELLSQLIIAHDLGFVNDETMSAGKLMVESISRKITALRASRG